MPQQTTRVGRRIQGTKRVSCPPSRCRRSQGVVPHVQSPTLMMSDRRLPLNAVDLKEVAEGSRFKWIRTGRQQFHLRSPRQSALGLRHAFDLRTLCIITIHSPIACRINWPHFVGVSRALSVDIGSSRRIKFIRPLTIDSSFFFSDAGGPPHIIGFRGRALVRA
jgi:hypothetical protein